MALYDQHTVAVAEEMVFLGDGVVVGGQKCIPASKCSGQHEYGAFWRVKIGQQTINCLKFVARIDEDVGFAA